MSDISRHYNKKLGLEAKLESSLEKVNVLYNEEARLRNELLSLPQVAPKLLRISQRSGVSEQTIINIAAVLEKYVTGKDRESFISKLEAYGGLKSAVQEL